MPRSSRSFLFPDVNVWVALTYGAHVHHSTARVWFEALDPEDRICFCRFTQLSLLRLLTTPAVMGADEAMTQTEAWQAYDRWMDDGRILFLDEPPNLETAFRTLSRRSAPTPKTWSDAYLAAFAAVSDMRFVTFDRWFIGKVNDLVVLKS